MGTLADLQEAHRKWLAHNFPNQTPHQALLGVGEEVGELMHAHLKMEQGIRGSLHEQTEAAQDAIGDIVIYLASYCNTNGFALEACVNAAWREVSARDWQANPTDGTTEIVKRAVVCTCVGPHVMYGCEVHDPLPITGAPFGVDDSGDIEAFHRGEDALGES